MEYGTVKKVKKKRNEPAMKRNFLGKSLKCKNSYESSKNHKYGMRLGLELCKFCTSELRGNVCMYNIFL